MSTNYTITTEGAPNVVSEIIIDGFLSDEDIEVLYSRWKSDWPAPIEFPGGVKGISCEAVLQVPQSKLNRTFGKVRGERIHHAAEVNSNA